MPFSRARIPGAIGSSVVASLLAALAVLAPTRISPLGRAIWIPGAFAQAGAFDDPRWKEVERLVGERKLGEAGKKTEELLAAAEKSGDERFRAEALIRATQLKIGLHGYETAALFLKGRAWPKDPSSRALLHLYYAHTLLRYQQSYGWEIGQREKTAPDGKVDLKAWTGEQIGAEIRGSFDAVLAGEAPLSGPPPAFFKPFIAKNNYPEGVRPTLRDAVVYLAVAHLADTSFWRPGEQTDVYKLGVESLLAAPAGRLTDGTRHPLAKLAGILNGHRAYHSAAGREGAALEARYETYRRLASALVAEGDKRRLRSRLADEQKRFRGVPWWPAGQALLADLVAAEDRPGKWVEALAVANEGLRVGGVTVGGRMCRAIVERIQSPDFSLTAMAVDGLGRDSLVVTYKNLRKLHFRAYAVDVESRWRSRSGNHPFPDQEEMLKIIAGGEKPAAEWSTDLLETRDRAHHRALVRPPLKSAGAYMIVASPGDRNGRLEPGSPEQDPFEQKMTERRPFRGAGFVVSDLVIEHGSLPGGGVEARIVSGASGKGVAGAEVSLWRYSWDKPASVIAKKASDADGYLRFDPGAAGASGSGFHFLAAKKGGDFTPGGDVWLGGAARGKDAAGVAFVYTDRSVYRPRQKVLWKVAAFEGKRSAAAFRSAAGASFAVRLYDPNNQVAAEKTVETNEFGTAAGEFDVPTGRPLGQWQIRVSSSRRASSGGGVSGHATVRVEEYKRPTFEAEFKDAEAPLRLNKRAKLKGEAKYHFGPPVSSGQVRWRVSRRQVSPWWWGYWGSGRDMRRRSQAPEIVASGQARLKEDGTFDVVFLPEADEREATNKDATYAFIIDADVTDDGGETRSASRSVRLGFTSVEARIDWSEGFFQEGKRAGIRVTRANLDGAPKAGIGMYRIARLIEPRAAQLPAELPRSGVDGTSAGEAYASEEDAGGAESVGGRFAHPGDARRARWETGYRWEAVTKEWEEGELVAGGSLNHGGDGLAAIELAALPKSGAYRVSYGTKDDSGALFEASRDFIVGSDKPELRLPFVMLTEATSVDVGGKARVLVHSGLVDQPVTFEVYRAGKRLSRKHLVAGAGGALLEIPVGKEDRGGFSVAATAVRDHQIMRREATIYVPWDDRRLELEFATFRDKLRPGGKETFTVSARSNDGKALGARSAEILAYMYDRSLDLFAPHAPPSPISVYPVEHGLARRVFGLGASRGSFHHGDFPPPAEAPGLREDRLLFDPDHGVGGPGNRGGLLERHSMLGESSAAFAASAEIASAGAASDSIAPGPVGLDSAEATGAVAAKGRVEAVGSGEGNEGSGPSAAGALGERARVREGFSETAFFLPHLVTDAGGKARFEFQVPDSVTSWSVWVHALTRDLRAGSASRETKTVKELMVRPYAPRFLREGDAAEIRIAVHNAGDADVSGELAFDIEDLETGASVAADFGLKGGRIKKPFSVKRRGATTLSFPLAAPRKIGRYAFKAVAKTKGASDGERRPFPVLPGRMHLAQSRFAALREGDRKTLEFKDLAAGGDPTLISEKMVVRVDAQLFQGVLSALPYLIECPYESTEQTMNRFLSAGIVSSVFRKHPAVAAMAREMSARKERLERFDEADANRRMTLEESPWLLEAGGGADRDGRAFNALDGRVAAARRAASLEKLREMQLPNGAWPWFQGGPPDAYMTLYVLHGFARAAEFGVDGFGSKEPGSGDAGRAMAARAWSYLKTWWDGDLQNLMREDAGWEYVTFVNYVLSGNKAGSRGEGAFSAADRRRMLDFSFKHWKRHSPLLKGYLALTLARDGRRKDAKLVWDSVMDAAKTDADLGTFWAAEDRSWLWYNDAVETHAFALRALMELAPRDERAEGMAQWLFLNKRLNHWKSTRATAEAIASLARYLDATASLGGREEVSVEVNGQRSKFAFEPGVYAGKGNQVVVEGGKVAPRTAKISVEKGGKGLAFASATWHFSTDRSPQEERGDVFSVSRRYFKRETRGKEAVLEPLADGARLGVGDQVEVRISLRAKHEAEYVHLRDPRAAGLEPENAVSGHRYDPLGLSWFEETRDSGANFFFSRLPAGEYTFKYRLRANMAGTFRAGPATVQSMYAPEFNAHSAGQALTVAPAE